MSDLELSTRSKLKELGLKSRISIEGEFYNCTDVAIFFQKIEVEIEQLKKGHEFLNIANDSLSASIDILESQKAKLIQENKKLREALEFYANEINWTSKNPSCGYMTIIGCINECDLDSRNYKDFYTKIHGGKLARKTLKELGVGK